MKKNILVIFGTRPEAIKLAPILLNIKDKSNFQVKVLVTAQQREMLDQVLEQFNIVPDFDLNLMKKNQTLCDIFVSVLSGVTSILDEHKFDIAIVHGDTSTALATALACFYKKIPVAHVEAGLRSFSKYSPFPEEMNRQIISDIASFHFAPTEENKQNLLKENIEEQNIAVVGNTVIDSLLYTIDQKTNFDSVSYACSSNIFGDKEAKDILKEWLKKDKIILFTAHRRENEEHFSDFFKVLEKIVESYSDIKIVYPMHKNPKIRELYNNTNKPNERILLIEPLNYIDFSHIMAKSYLVLTDSGGIQEEAPALDIPVVVLRNETERSEGLKAGTIFLAGTNKEQIFEQVKLLIENNDVYKKISSAKNPYGDGKSSERIIEFLEKVV